MCSIPILALAPGATLLAGCAGGDDAAERPDPAREARQEAAFRSRAEPACERLSRAVATVETPSTFPPSCATSAAARRPSSSARTATCARSPPSTPRVP